MSSNLDLITVPRCPPGFDCALLNSCPAYIQPCPDGFFCGSYEGLKHQSLMDFRYAEYAYQYVDDVTITHKNKGRYIDPDRVMQAACLDGFYCPDATSMEICPADHWCPERTVVPHNCDALSACFPEGGGFQVNFINTVIMAALVLLTLSCSSWLLYTQKRSDSLSKKKAPSSSTAAVPAVALSNVAATDAVVAFSTDEDKAIIEADPQSQSQASSPTTVNGAIGIKFSNLLFKTASSRVILPEISGEIPPGKITGILGPTACGKSTLLNALRSRGHNCNSGEVKVSIVDPITCAIQSDHSSESERVSHFADMVGYVPQEDILDRELTVRELLLFNTLARGRSQIKGHSKNHSQTSVPLSFTEANVIVNQVLSHLSIEHVADAIIGGGENKAPNISGGQLKRVNIAVELVALTASSSLGHPSLLLLDEPTAGLDATIAFELVETLQRMVHQQRDSRHRVGGGAGGRGMLTIVMVLQQPRVEIFERLEHLLLMNRCGGIVYEGLSCHALSYLTSSPLNYQIRNEDTSDADFCLDVMNGMTVRRNMGGEGEEEEMYLPDNLHLYWKKQQHQDYQLEANGIVSSTREVTPSLLPSHHDSNSSGSSLSSSLSSSSSWSKYFHAISLNAQRLLKIRLRNRSSLWVYIAINAIMAIALSSGFSILLQSSYYGVLNPSLDEVLQAYFPSPYARYSKNNVMSMGFAQLLFFMSSALGCASCLTSVPVLAGCLSLAKRESSVGIPVTSFVIGRLLADIFFVLVNAFVFAGVWCLFGHVGVYYDWIAVIVCTAFASSGIGYIASTLVTRKNSASVIAIILCFICCVFAGVEPRLSQVENYPVVSWPWYLSFATWTAEATYITWSRYLLNDGHVSIPLQDGADEFGYDVENGFGRSIGALIALGIGMRVLATYLLWKKSK